MNLADPLQLDLVYRVLYALAGAAGGAIRWWSAKSPLGMGLIHLAIGAIAGTFLNGFVFAIIRGAVDWANMSELDGKLLGAHLAGYLGLLIYAVVPDLLSSWARSKASPPTPPQEPQP